MTGLPRKDTGQLFGITAGVLLSGTRLGERLWRLDELTSVRELEV